MVPVPVLIAKDLSLNKNGQGPYLHRALTGEEGIRQIITTDMDSNESKKETKLYYQRF